MADDREPHNFKSTANSTKNVFPFSNQHSRNSQSGQTSNFSLFQAIAQRSKNNVRESHPNQPHQRIFPPVNYSTPQSPRARMEMTPSEESHDYPSDEAHAIQPSIHSQTGSQIHVMESHQLRFMPMPKTVERGPPSRAPSEAPSMGSVVDADSEDLDFSEMMNRKIKEGKLVKSQLAEERVVNANLRSELSVIKASYEDQKQSIAELEAAAEASREHIDSKDAQLRQLQASLDEAQSAKDSQLTLISRKDQEILAGQEKVGTLEVKLKEAEDRVARVKEKTKESFELMTKNFDSLKKSVEYLKTRYEMANETVPKMYDELESLRKISQNGFKELEPYMDSSGRHLIKATETRNLIEELQTDRHNAQQVIQFLRDKLHNQSTELAEANEKVAEAELHRKEEGDRLSHSVILLGAAGQQIEVVASKLAKREREDAEVLTEGLRLESQLAEANERIGSLSEKLGQKEAEVERLKEEKQSLATELQVKTGLLEVTSNRLKELTEESVAHQRNAQTKEGEVSVLNEKLRASEESKGILQAA
ncbi:hypothetical protein GYMLUDRAFT_971742 [Collybiopsis luxurians FD-317 M1]|uniref:Uncharacterized protein n=1 Tax=Collybiopsis luxurians FD-317 M1 TaxID=944289 RepID=A0A0D0BCK0_9AGAR|nr:hypothetical protein GYMLUDRAFT_971742 [Collybiopsis luxurians FD-317 M1]